MVPLGIPHSEFLSWSESDQDMALAYVEFQREICKSCGTIDADFRDEKGRLLDPPPMEAVDMLCAGCRMTNDHRNFLENEAKADMAGRYIALRPYTPKDDD